MNCKWCDRRKIECPHACEGATVCPLQLACADCPAKPGQWCKRPSGHKAQTLHMPRVREADATAPGNGGLF